MAIPTEKLRQPRKLSLFSGIGGGCLGSKILGWRTVCYIEKNEFCQSILKKRIDDGILDDAPIWDDVQTFDGEQWNNCVDIVTAGFPCQPFSIAGKQQAGKDERNMWQQTARIIGEVRPPIGLLENVPNLARGEHGYYGRVIGDLAELGYNAIWDIIPAAAVDAPHRRERLWILCWDSDADEGRLKRCAKLHRQRWRRFDGKQRHNAMRFCEDVADASGRRGPKNGLPAGRQESWSRGSSKIRDTKRPDVESSRREKDVEDARGERQEQPRGDRSRTGEARKPERMARWPPEPDLGRVVDGVPNKVDRLQGLGNAQVPQQMAIAFDLLSQRMLGFLESSLMEVNKWDDN